MWSAWARFDPLGRHARLDPRIHHLCKICARKMDPRVKPAGDGGGLLAAPDGSATGSSAP